MKTVPVIGMSPGNSYFTYEVIKNTIRNVIEKFDYAVVLIPDVPAIHTYIALGYPENRARRDKAIPKGNNLKNKVQKAVYELHYLDKVRIVDWGGDIEKNHIYQKSLNIISKFYQENKLFRESANAATNSVLQNSGKAPRVLDNAITIGVKYLLAEIAFMISAPELFCADKVIYIYHKPWPVYEDYINGKFKNRPNRNLGFLTL